MTKHVESFWERHGIAIVIYLISLAFSSGIIYSRQEVLIKGQEEMKAMWIQLEKRVGTAEININTLLVKDSLR